ncbi:MAG: hypothetical protein GY869_00960, partial [Planctomycetes bacterium]|nr:hypothetical protein [Planctomycetota bacterium]
LIEQLDDLYYPGFDVDIRALGNDMGYLIDGFKQAVSSIITQRFLTDINNDLYIANQALPLRQDLDQVLSDLADVQATIVQLTNDIAAVDVELATHPNMDTILSWITYWQDEIATIQSNLSAMDLQYTKVAFQVYLLPQLSGEQGNNMNIIDDFLQYVDMYINEIDGEYIPDYKPPLPEHGGKEIFNFNPRDSRFYAKPNVVHWNYFNIADGVMDENDNENIIPYGPNKWKLSDITNDRILALYDPKTGDLSRLLQLRDDLFKSWIKTDHPDHVDDEGNPLIGDLHAIYDGLIAAGGSEDLDPKLPQTQAGCVNLISQYESDLSNANIEEGIWLNEQTIVQELEAERLNLVNLRGEAYYEEYMLQNDQYMLEGSLNQLGYLDYTLLEIQQLWNGFDNEQTTLVGDIDDAITYLDAQKSYLDTQIASLTAQRIPVQNDFYALWTILDVAYWDLYYIVPTEEIRLGGNPQIPGDQGERGVLEVLQSNYSSDMEQMESILINITSLLPYEQMDLQTEIDALNVQYDELDVLYQAALSEETQLTQTIGGLNVELDDLNLTVGDSQLLIDTDMIRVGELDDDEFDLKVQLNGIVAQKWVERTDLGGIDLGNQQVEAEILNLAQIQVMDQGAVAFTGFAETYRNRVDADSLMMDNLSTDLELLKTEQLTLGQQLEALQTSSTDPTHIRIEAKGYQGPIDKISSLDDYTFEFWPNFGINPDFTRIPGPTDGILVRQDEFSGYFMYQNTVTDQILYRDVKGMSEENGEDVYTEDHTDDTFYTWDVDLEYRSGPDTWHYTDIKDTPDDTEDDKEYEVQLVGGAPYAVYPAEISYVVKQLQGTTSEIHKETRINAQGLEVDVDVNIISDVFSVHDYRYDILITTTSSEDPIPSDPGFDWESATLFVLDTVSMQAESLADVLLDDESVVLANAIVLYPGQTLADKGITELDRNDILISFTEFTPVYTPLSLDEFTFINPEDYTDTEFGPDESLPDIYTELLHNGDLVVPLIDQEDGTINLAAISFASSDIMTMIGPYGIKGLELGEAFSAKELYLESQTDLTVGGNLKGIDLVQIETDGDLYLENGALVEAAVVNFVSEFGSIFGENGSLLRGNIFNSETTGDVVVFSDFKFYDIDVFGMGNVNIFDSNTKGIGKTISLTNINTGAGDVTFNAEDTIQAFYVGADNINLFTHGSGGIEVGTLQTWASSIVLDSARGVSEIAGVTSDVIGGDVIINAGLDITAPYESWTVPTVEPFGNLSILIDASYTGPLQLDVERDIIIDTVIDTPFDIDFTANNIIFTENGAINNTAGDTALYAQNSVQFSNSRTFGGDNTPTIQGDDIFIESLNILGGENNLISGSVLSLISEQGFGLRTEVDQLHASVLGAGNLKIDSLSSLELADVNVFNGTLDVASTGSIIARDVEIVTDSYANKLNFNAAGTISFNGVHVGQLTDINIHAGAGYAGMVDALVVEPTIVEDQTHAGDPLTVHVEVTDPTYLYRPAGSNIELVIDYGDGTPTDTVFVLYQTPDPEVIQDPDLVLQDAFGIQVKWRSRSAISAADVNGDNYSDLVVGQTAYDTLGNERNGRIQVYLGSDTGLNTTPTSTIYGTQSGDGFGQILASAGDVNNDGHDDIIVGAPDKMVEVFKTVVNPDGTTTQVSEMVQGEISLYLGNAEGLNSESAWTMAGLDYNSVYSFNVSPAGDINNDGFDDLLVAQPVANVVERNGDQAITIDQAGMVELYLGSSSGLESSPIWTYYGDQINGYFGSSASSMGDLNGDGFDEIIVGAALEDTDTYTNNGQAYLFMSNAGALSLIPDQTFKGTQNNALFGWDVQGVDDVNNDGYPDMIVAASGYDSPTFNNRGAVYLYLGTPDGIDPEPQFVDVPESLIDKWFGWELANTGDFNKDGFSDFLAMAASQGGTGEPVSQAFLYLGSPTGVSPLIIQLPKGAFESSAFSD